MKKNNVSGEDGDLCVFNGIDGATGEYLVPPISPQEVVEVLQGRPFRKQGRRAMMPGLDPRDLAEAGWGVVFHRDAGPRDPRGAGGAVAGIGRRRREHGTVSVSVPTATAAAMNRRSSSPASGSAPGRSTRNACRTT